MKKKFTLISLHKLSGHKSILKLQLTARYIYIYIIFIHLFIFKQLFSYAWLLIESVQRISNNVQLMSQLFHHTVDAGCVLQHVHALSVRVVSHRKRSPDGLCKLSVRLRIYSMWVKTKSRCQEQFKEIWEHQITSGETILNKIKCTYYVHVKQI